MTTPTAPRDVKPGDVVRRQTLDADLAVTTEDVAVESVEKVARARYRIRYVDGEYEMARTGKHLLEVVR